MIRCLTAILLSIFMLAGAGRGTAAQLTHGLMWRDSPLSAQFPLVVKTPPGMWFYLQLLDAETTAPVLAAGIEGGRFFRVLVPNGRYVVDIAYGHDWQGEERGFAPGDGAGRLQIDPPLDFAVEGVARKAGHVIGLVPDAEGDGFDVTLHGQAVCQRIALELVPDPEPGFEPRPSARGLSERPLPPGGWDLQIRRVICD